MDFFKRVLEPDKLREEIKLAALESEAMKRIGETVNCTYSDLLEYITDSVRYLNKDGMYQRLDIPVGSNILAELMRSYRNNYPEDWINDVFENIGRNFWMKNMATYNDNGEPINNFLTTKEKFYNLMLEFDTSEYIFADAGQTITETVIEYTPEQLPEYVQMLYPPVYLAEEIKKLAERIEDFGYGYQRND